MAVLNTIVHPAVQQRRLELQRAAAERGDAIVVNDIPLLFEVLDPAQFDVVVLIDAPAALRRTRLRTLRGLPNQDADRMITAQMPAERKRAQSHFTIENERSLKTLERRARKVFEELRRRAAAAALGRPARTLLLVAPPSDAKHPALSAIGARYGDAGLAVHRVADSRSALEKALQRPDDRPDAIVAVHPAAPAAEQAWTRAGRPGVLAYLSPVWRRDRICFHRPTRWVDRGFARR